MTMNKITQSIQIVKYAQIVISLVEYNNVYNNVSFGYIVTFQHPPPGLTTDVVEVVNYIGPVESSSESSFNHSLNRS